MTFNNIVGNPRSKRAREMDIELIPIYSEISKKIGMIIMTT